MDIVDWVHLLSRKACISKLEYSRASSWGECSPFSAQGSAPWCTSNFTRSKFPTSIASCRGLE